MKIKQVRLSGYCLAIVLILVLTLVVSACGSASSSTNTVTSSTLSSTIIATTTTNSSSSSKTTTTTKVTSTLVSIAITPNPPHNLEIGASTITFTATGPYSDGTTADISSLVTWTSSDPTIAEFTQPTGDS